MFKPKHSFIPDHEKLRFVLDTETLSLEPDAAVIDIALVEIAGNERTFSAQIKPSAYENPNLDFSVDPQTVAWHKKTNPAFLNLCEQRGEQPETAVGRLFDFLVDIQELEDKQVVIYCQGTDFDIPIMKNLFASFGASLPWHYRNVRDLRSFNALHPNVVYVAGNHTALEDARKSKDHLLKLAASDPTMFQYVWGYLPE